MNPEFPTTSQTIGLQEWNDIHEYQKPGWVFRGQRLKNSDGSEDLELDTSLERCCKREKLYGLERFRLEQELIREFKRAYYQYGHNPPGDDCLVEWISIMRHHGAPTRLLDFTYSIYVAAYFALEDGDSDCDRAIWAIRVPWASEESAVAFASNSVKRKDAETLVKPTESSSEPAYCALLFEPPFVKAAAPINPFRLTERLRSQKGIFVVPGDVSVSFVENLTALTGYDSVENVRKIILPMSWRGDVLEKLHYMNVSRTSLFPGLDGYAMSLGVFHPSFKPDPMEDIVASCRRRIIGK